MQDPLSLLFGVGPVDYAQLPHSIACLSESVHMHYCIILPITHHNTLRRPFHRRFVDSTQHDQLLNDAVSLPSPVNL